jgi:hypothetical protein
MEDPPLERHLLADALAHDGLGAVIQQLAGDAAEVPKRLAVARPERSRGPASRSARRSCRASGRAPCESNTTAASTQSWCGSAPRATSRPAPETPAPSQPHLRSRRRLGAASARRSGAPCHSRPKAVVAHQILIHPRGQLPRLRRRPLVDQRLKRIQLQRHPPAPVDRLRTVLEIALHRPPIAAEQGDLSLRRCSPGATAP